MPLPSSKDDDDDDEDEEEDAEEREKKKQRQLGQDSSVKSFLSSMPVPRNSAGSTLGAAPSSGSGRRSAIETEVPEPTSSGTNANGVNNEVAFDSNVGNNNQGNWGYGSNVYNQEVQAGGDQSYAGYEGVGGYGSSGGYDSYGNYANYESGLYDTSSGAMAPEASGAMVPETTGGIESFVNMDGRRRKGKVPTQIVEVKQDELMKNRPREDLSKMTGLAFGPSYQPAPATKGKPTKLAKRKHQIGSLYFDLKQKEMELAERRSKGLLTKAETQAKYGW